MDEGRHRGPVALNGMGSLLRFGTATATAWILASLLIGFTVFQLRLLSKVEFRRAETT